MFGLVATPFLFVHSTYPKLSYSGSGRFIKVNSRGAMVQQNCHRLDALPSPYQQCQSTETSFSQRDTYFTLGRKTPA